MKIKLLALLSVAALLASLFAACAPATPLVVEKEVVKEVPVEKQVVVEKEVVKEVPVEKVVEKEVVKEVPVEKVVEKKVEVAVTATPAPEKTYELVWMCRTGPVENKWEQEVVKPAFEARHPNIALKILIIDQDDIAVKREAMIAAKQPLHVWSTNWGGDGFASDRYRGLLEDLTPLIERDNFDIGDFVPEIWSTYQVEGKQWGIPLLSTGSYLYYNQKLFDEAGVEYPPTDWDDTSWTWDAMVEMAKKLTKNYGDPAKAQYGIIYRPWDGGEKEMVGLMFGKNIWPDDAFDTGFATEVYAEAPGVIKGYQAIHDLIYKHKVMPDATLDDALWALGGAFQSGTTAMEIMGGWGHWDYMGLSEEFCWGAAAVPYGDPAWKGPRATIYTDPWVITAGMPDDEREVAWTFVKYLTSVEASRAYMESTKTPPVRSSLLEGYFTQYEPCMTPEEAEESFMGGIKYGLQSSNHLMIRYDEMSEAWSSALDEFWLGADMTAEEAMQVLDARVEETLQRIKAEEEK